MHLKDNTESPPSVLMSCLYRSSWINSCRVWIYKLSDSSSDQTTQLLHYIAADVRLLQPTNSRKKESTHPFLQHELSCFCIHHLHLYINRYGLSFIASFRLHLVLNWVHLDIDLKQNQCKLSLKSIVTFPPEHTSSARVAKELDLILKLRKHQ